MIAQLKKDNLILQGRLLMGKAIRSSDGHPILNLPIEYVEYCTHNFTCMLDDGGTSDVYLATDSEDPYIRYAVKRVLRLQKDKTEGVTKDPFLTELEVSDIYLFAY